MYKNDSGVNKSTVHGKNLVGEKLANLVNRELFAKISSPILTDTPKMHVFGICTDYSFFAKFFLANIFYLHGSPKLSPAKYFSCTVLLKHLNENIRVVCRTLSSGDPGNALTEHDLINTHD